MSHILIVESNTPDMVEKGRSEAEIFVRTLADIAPNVTLKVVSPYVAPVEEDVLASVDGVAFTGSGVDWNTSDERAMPLADFMREVLASGKPCWGSCNGMQLVASVLRGGAVGQSPNGREEGLARAVTLTGAGQAHPMMAGRPEVFSALCVHRDEVVSLPDGAVLLASNAHSPVQAFAYSADGVDFWGTQYHPEYSPVKAAMGPRARAGDDPEKLEFVDLLERAETDDAAARALGTRADEMSLPLRAIELSNWLEHVAGRRGI